MKRRSSPPLSLSPLLPPTPPHPRHMDLHLIAGVRRRPLPSLSPSLSSSPPPSSSSPMRCTGPPSCLLSLRSAYSTLFFLSLVFLLSLLSSPSTAQSAAFNPTKKYTVTFGILLDVTGTVEQENLTDVYVLYKALQWATSAPTFFVYPNVTSGLNIPLSVTFNGITRDTVCDPIKSSLGAYDLTIPASNVAALIGPPCSAATEATVPVAAMYSLPQISYGATDDLLNDITRFSWLLRSVGNDAARAGVMVEAMLEYGWDHFTVIAQKSSFGLNMLNDLSMEGQNAGLTLVGSLTYYMAQPNWTAIIDYVIAKQQLGSHVFVIAANDVTCQQVLVTLWQRGLMMPGNVWIAAGANCVDASVNGSVDATLLGQAIPGVLFVNNSFNASAPQYVAFLDEYAVASNATSTPIVPYENLLLFDTMLTLAYGFKNLFYQGIAPGLSTGAALLASIIQNVSFVGVTGPVSYSPYDQTRMGVAFGLFQVNRTGGVVNLATAVVSGQTFTYDMTAIPTYNVTMSGAAAYWLGTGAVPLSWTPPPAPLPPTHSGISISTQVLTVIICIACLVLCCILAGVSFVALWRAKTTKVMSRLSQALAEAERARRNEAEAYKAKSQFLANMSHEIRTPMNGVCGMAALLASTPLSEEQCEYVKSIEISTGHLLTVISDVLDFGKMESGKMEMEVTQCELRRIVEEAVEISCSQKGGGRCSIVIYCDPILPEFVQVDPTRLRQIITNLLSNAIKFGRGGPIFLRLREHMVEDDHLYALQPLPAHEGVRVIAAGVPYGEHRWAADERVEMPQTGVETSVVSSSPTTSMPSTSSSPSTPLILHISIEDKGHGIAKSHLHKLFKPFSQSDSSISRQFGGTGLGLVISGKLAQMMGGTIWCESAQDVGSKFSFTFNAGIKSDEGTMPVTPVTPNDTSSGEGTARGTTAMFGRPAQHHESTLMDLGYRTSASDSSMPSPVLSAIITPTARSMMQNTLLPKFRLQVVVVASQDALLHSLASTLHALGCSVYACESSNAANAFMKAERIDLVLLNYEPHYEQPSIQVKEDSLEVASRLHRSHSMDERQCSEPSISSFPHPHLGGLPPAPPLIGTLDRSHGPLVAVLLNLDDEKHFPLTVPPQKKLRKPLKHSDLLRILHHAELDSRHRLERDAASAPPEVIITVQEEGESPHASARSVSAPSTMRGSRQTLLSRAFPLHILCVEDNLINQRLFVRMMQRMGYTVDVADNGLKALELLRASASDPYDLVWMDMQMPEMDGLSCAHYIAAEYAQQLPTSFPAIDPAISIAPCPASYLPIWSSTTPRPPRPVIIALTANASAKDRELCMACGMHDYAAKPFTQAVLEEKIRHWGPLVKQRKATGGEPVGRHSLE